MSKQPEKYAVIYCRVSSKKQKKMGHGLDSQELRCRQHAETMGVAVEAVFPDDITGGGDFMKRPGMVALLSYLDAQPDKRYVVIFDDLKRFARDTEFHLKLRRAFKLRNARIECLNFKFEDTPEGKFIETVLAAQGELEREQNGRQVVQKMQARLFAGYWCFRPAIGYKYDRVDGHGKLLVRDEPLASVVTEALEGYASSRFDGVVEVKRFLESQPAFPKEPDGSVHFQRVNDLLIRPIYGGYIDVPEWNISMQLGKHEPLVTARTWHRIQERLKGFAKAPMRKDISEDFPLRGFVACGCCGEPLTAAWSKGRSALYPYYLCDTKGCVEYRKSIRRDRIEGEFAQLLEGMVPSRDLFLMVYEMLSDLWERKLAQINQAGESALRAARDIDRKIEQLMDRIMATDSETLISAYENQVKKLEAEKRFLADNPLKLDKPKAGFKQTYRTAMAFLANPCKLWASEHIADKRLVLRLAFSTHLRYFKNEGYRTGENTLPFKALMAVSEGKKDLVELSGIEPLTSCMPCKRSPS